MNQYIVEIKNLKLDALIGILPHEQNRPQQICVSVSALLAANKMPSTMNETLCYASVVQYIEGLASTQHQLVEELATKIAQFCLYNGPVREVSVTLLKTEILPQTSGVGVTVNLSNKQA